jgi:alpha-galactosidase
MAFNMTLLHFIFQDWRTLHSKGLKLGVYAVSGAFCTDGSKTVDGTNIKSKATFEVGINLIKLAFKTPGSPENGGHLPSDNSRSDIASHDNPRANSP